MSDDRNDKSPSHVAYQVKDVGEDKAYFNRIGAAFRHRDGEGFNVVLDSVPVDGKITLRTPSERLKDTREGRSDNNKGYDRGR